MKISTRVPAVVLAAGVCSGLLAPLAAHASVQGKKNTAYALAGLGVYGAVTKKPLVAGLGFGGGIYSYMKANEEAGKERARKAARVRRASTRKVASTQRKTR